MDDNNRENHNNKGWSLFIAMIRIIRSILNRQEYVAPYEYCIKSTNLRNDGEPRGLPETSAGQSQKIATSFGKT